jgi:hypothetical protein
MTGERDFLESSPGHSPISGIATFQPRAADDYNVSMGGGIVFEIVSGIAAVLFLFHKEAQIGYFPDIPTLRTTDCSAGC